ncbi:MAG: hypothetical protein QOG97_203, partial [Acidimicrobiaceae bacterium]|nr:hypothetical protein [Acidimicrobiaceae bacterium]
MCDSADHELELEYQSETELGNDSLTATRRSFLKGAGWLAATSAMLSGTSVFSRVTRAFAATPTGAQGPIPMAMHIHSSFSEGSASMLAQLSEARRNNVPVVWFTEHDWRMSAHGYRQAVHFDSLLKETEAPNKAWQWREMVKGKPVNKGGGIVTAPVSPLDPHPPGAMHVMVQAGPNRQSSFSYGVDANKARLNYKANLAGHSLSIEIFPSTVGPDAWLELRILCSQRPAMNGRPAGGYSLVYRFGTAQAGHAAHGLEGVVSIPAVTGQWNSVTLKPVDDIAALWPDLQADDNSMRGLWLGATGVNSSVAEGYFDYLRFDRDAAGDVPLAVQSRLLDAYRPQFSELSIYSGLEVSLEGNHINWLGGDQHLYQYPGSAVLEVDPTFATFASDLIHQRGGLSSTNHPFTASVAPDGTPLQQETLRRDVAKVLLGNRANHSDIFEVGYRSRGSCNLETHMGLWDTLSRNGLWLTGNGASDNHDGSVGSWATDTNRFFTHAWSPSAGLPDLMACLASGRVFVGEMGSFSGALDISVEGNPMGSISVLPGRLQRTLTISGSQLPTGGSVEVVQGPVDYGGVATPDPGTNVVTTLTASLVQGGADVLLDTSASSFVRLNVLDGSGKRVGFSNPVWLL